LVLSLSKDNLESVILGVYCLF